MWCQRHLMAEAQEGFLEEGLPLLLRLLTLVEHITHVLHILGVIIPDISQAFFISAFCGLCITSSFFRFVFEFLDLLFYNCTSFNTCFFVKLLCLVSGLASLVVCPLTFQH